MNPILIFVLLAFVNCDEVLVSRYARMLELTRDRVGPPTNSLLEILDPYHQRQNTSGLYTSPQIVNLDNTGFAHYLNQFGLDFSSATVNPPYGTRSIPGATLYPWGVTFATGNSFRTALDSTDKKKGKNNNWFNVDYGFLAQMTTNGTFTSGVVAGTTYNVGDLMGHVELNMLKDGGDWSRGSKDRLTFIVRSLRPSFQKANYQGLLESYVISQIIDSDGNPGTCLEIVGLDKLSDGNISQATRRTCTWPLQ
jgi:hypothetical protein